MKKTIKVLYEDDFLIVFDKPAGLLVIPSPKQEKNTLSAIVNREFPPRQGRLHPCHRLDRDTTGIIIYAKGKTVQQRMMQSFQQQAVEKTYIAFVRGRPEPAKGRIVKSIPDRWAGHVTARSSDGSRGLKSKTAVTDYETMSGREGFSVVKVFPRTGRTNQIRIHFKGIGHPVLGERVYAFGRDFPVRFHRLALHAARISFPHPVSREKVTIVSDLPADMQDFLKKMAV